MPLCLYNKRASHETRIVKKRRHSECFYREPSDFSAFKKAESPIEVFGGNRKYFVQRS